MSAFIKDVRVGDLPKEVRATIKQFIPIKANTKVAHYGMTPKELIGKADPHNLATARQNVRTIDEKTCRRKVRLSQRRASKFVLIQNDRIVDGHHHLAKAERAKVTSSLHVLDLTPARFQMSAKAKPIQFDRPLGYEAGVPLTGKVARDRYVKRIHDADLDRRDANMLRSGTAGAIAGTLILRRGRILTRAAVGGTAGAGGVLAVRAATKKTRDPYGERSRAAKRAETIPTAVGGGAAALGASKLIKRKFKLSACGKVIEFREKPQMDPAIKTGISSAISGAGLGLIPAFNRANSASKVLKSVGHGAGLGLVIGGGGTFIGEKILGSPRKDEGAPITKRAALGASIAAIPLGAAAVLAARRGAKIPGVGTLEKAAQKGALSRPARFLKKAPLPVAVGAGAAGAALAAGVHGADEGQQVDTLNSLHRDRQKKLFAAHEKLIELDQQEPKKSSLAEKLAAAGVLTAGGGVAYAGLRVGKAAKATEAAAQDSRKVMRSARMAAAKPYVIGKKLQRAGGMMKAQLTTFPTLARISRKLKFRVGSKAVLIEFGRSDQPRWKGSGKFGDPVEGFARGMSMVNADGSDWHASSPQLGRALIRQAHQKRIQVQRGVGLTRDISDTLSGAPRRKDAAGRAKKREWEKPWFHNAIATAAIAGTAGAGILLRRYARVNPGTPTARVVKKTEARVRLGRQKLENLTGRTMDRLASGLGLEATDRKLVLLQAHQRMIELEYYDPGTWDLRDARGKSARVFAPGSRKRVRRTADWHETKQGQRHILTGAGVAGAALTGAAAFAIGKRIGGKVAVARVLKVQEENKKAAIAKGLATKAQKLADRRKAEASGVVTQAFPKRRKIGGSGPGPTAA